MVSSITFKKTIWMCGLKEVANVVRLVHLRLPLNRSTAKPCQSHLFNTIQSITLTYFANLFAVVQSQISEKQKARHKSPHSVNLSEFSEFRRSIYLLVGISGAVKISMQYSHKCFQLFELLKNSNFLKKLKFFVASQIFYLQVPPFKF